jgi:hypothetical protein
MEDEICRAYSMHRRGEKYIKLWLDNLKERNHVEDLSLDGRIILKGS